MKEIVFPNKTIPYTEVYGTKICLAKTKDKYDNIELWKLQYVPPKHDYIWAKLDDCISVLGSRIYHSKDDALQGIFNLFSTVDIYEFENIMDKVEMTQEQLEESWHETNELVSNTDYTNVHSFYSDNIFPILSATGRVQFLKSQFTDDNSWNYDFIKEEAIAMRAIDYWNELHDEEYHFYYQSIPGYLTNHKLNNDITIYTACVLVSEDIDLFFDSIQACLRFQLDSYFEKERAD